MAAAVRDLAPDGVDAVLDLVGGDALRDSADLVRTPGRLVSIVDADTVAEMGGTYVFVRPDVAHLAELARLADGGRLRTEVQQVRPLDDVRAAVEALEAGHVRGKVLLTADLQRRADRRHPPPGAAARSAPRRAGRQPRVVRTVAVPIGVPSSHRPGTVRRARGRGASFRTWCML
jgi:hypothetical protein